MANRLAIAAALALAALLTWSETPLAAEAVLLPGRETSDAVPPFLPGASGGGRLEPVPPEQAFVLTASVADAHTLRLRFAVHDCCYLYRDKLRFALAGRTGAPLPPGARLGAVQLPPGQTMNDPYFGGTAVYRSALAIELPLLDVAPGAAFALDVTYQGCSEEGVVLCYQPITRRIPLRTEGKRLVIDGPMAAPPTS